MAIDIFNELKKGNIDVLEKLIHSDRKVAIELIKDDSDKNKILRKILPLFKEKGTWYGLAHDIFNLIYLESEFKEYTYYLLHSQFVMLEDLTEKEVNNILSYTTWGFNYILDNIDECLYSDRIYRIIKNVVTYTISDDIKFQMLKDKCLNSKIEQVRCDFIVAAISKHIELDKKDIIGSIYNNPNDHIYKQETLPFYNEKHEYICTSLPEFLLFHASKNKNIENMMLENFDLFFKSDLKAKMKILNYFYNKLPQEYIKKYQDIYELYLKQPTSLIDKYISILLNNDLEDWLITLLKDKKSIYLTSGSTTSAFKIGDEVLKFSLQKHNIHTVKDLFLIIPTEERIIYNNNKEPIMIVEVQDYLEDSYNGIKITKEDIDNFFEELDNQGYELTDPHCLNKEFNNFGFLKDYHDANLGNYKSYDELPEWFKERPIVLYDVDLVYKKEEKNKMKFIC